VENFLLLFMMHIVYLISNPMNTIANAIQRERDDPIANRVSNSKDNKNEEDDAFHGFVCCC